MSSQTRTPNVLSALANKAFKVTVSCLTVWCTGQASTGSIYLKRAVSCDKTSRYYDAIFYSVALVSCMRLWLHCDYHCTVIFFLSFLLVIYCYFFLFLSYYFYWLLFFFYLFLFFIYCYFLSFIFHLDFLLIIYFSSRRVIIFLSLLLFSFFPFFLCCCFFFVKY